MCDTGKNKIIYNTTHYLKTVKHENKLNQVFHFITVLLYMCTIYF